MMRWLRLALIVLMLVGVGACAAGNEPRTFDHPELSFVYPADWQLMSELWPAYQARENHLNLGVDEIVKVTSVRKQGESGMWATVASAPLGTQALTAFIDASYAEAVPEVEDLTRATATVGDLVAIECVYRRPWGEPWYAFRDLWFESNGTAYLLSFQATALDGYGDAMAVIVDSFRLEAGE